MHQTTRHQPTIST